MKKTFTIELTIPAERAAYRKEIKRTIELTDTALGAIEILDEIQEFYDYKISEYEAKIIVRNAIKNGSTKHTI